MDWLKYSPSNQRTINPFIFSGETQSEELLTETDEDLPTGGGGGGGSKISGSMVEISSDSAQQIILERCGIMLSCK